ncbi:hypothetical protein CYMTET_19642 [Cymbomonas tetramitiformis]|uniref:Uncharacterized protein n=1 Tax=Cymbomonas tetramitiformis TaxID=36881 RepID=A0AAE0G5K5_9CHLO|nr:hypothetical protein CYMTET_19642 [Cymbomonas tetramitiformis]
MNVNDPQMMTVNDSQMMTVNDSQMMTVDYLQMMTVDEPQMMAVDDAIVRPWSPMPVEGGQCHLTYWCDCRQTQTFKWMIFSDDDAFFFMPNLLELLEPLDPDVPYIISDDIANCCHHFCQDPPAGCRPPTMDPLMEYGKNGTCYVQPAVAPCYVATLLDDSTMCRPSNRNVYFNGGRGAILSRGLLTRISSEHWERCETHLTGGGDNRISSCLWKAGYGPTIPTEDMSQCRFRPVPSAAHYDGSEAGGRPRLLLLRCAHMIYKSVSVPFPIHHKSGTEEAVQQVQQLHTIFNRLRTQQIERCPEPVEEVREGSHAFELDPARQRRPHRRNPGSQVFPLMPRPDT